MDTIDAGQERESNPADPQEAEPEEADLQEAMPDDAGMSTAEYAIGTVAACGFAGVLWAVVHSDAVARLMQGVVERALTLGT